MSKKREFRNWKTQVRTQTIGGRLKVVGYASVYNQLSEPMRVGNRTFRERVMPGAFDKNLRGADIRGLVNHNPSMILGRTKSGTMNVSSDVRGLRYEIDPPNTSYANDLIESLDRGDIDQSSFGFYTIKDNWVTNPDGSMIREVIEADVFDCSPVTFPAYPDATSGIEARSFPDGLPSSFGKTASGKTMEDRKRHLRYMEMRSHIFSLHKTPNAVRRRQLSDIEARAEAMQFPERTKRSMELRRMYLRDLENRQRNWRR